jgi:hypothetical protein
MIRGTIRNLPLLLGSHSEIANRSPSQSHASQFRSQRQERRMSVSAEGSRSHIPTLLPHSSSTTGQPLPPAEHWSSGAIALSTPKPELGPSRGSFDLLTLSRNVGARKALSYPAMISFQKIPTWADRKHF